MYLIIKIITHSKFVPGLKFPRKIGIDSGSLGCACQQSAQRCAEYFLKICSRMYRKSVFEKKICHKFK